MKNYTITVNGNVYDVTVEENGAGAAPKAAPKAPKAAPKAAPAPKAPAKAAGAGSVRRQHPPGRAGSNEDGNSSCGTGRRNSCKH